MIITNKSGGIYEKNKFTDFSYNYSFVYYRL